MISEKNQMLEKTRVVVIGAGLGGLCAGVKLREAGIDDFLIFDRHPKVGGVWYENKYADHSKYKFTSLFEKS